MESSSSSDVLPDLETKQSTESINIIGDSYSYDDDENYSEDYDSHEHDWKSHQQSIQNKTKPKPQPPTPTPPPSDPNKMRRKLPQRGRRTIKSRPLQSPPQQPITPVSPKANQNDSDSKKSEKDSNDYSSSSEKENDEHSGKIHNSNSVSVIDPEISKERNIPTNNNNDNNDNTPVNSNPIQEYYPPQTPSSAPSNGGNNNYNIDQMNKQIIQKPIQNNPANEQSYQISYERALTLWKRPVQMTKNDILVFACQSVHDKVYKKVHIISTSNKNPISFTSPHYSGMIVRHQNGSRFTVFGKSEGGKPAPQLAGISFIDLNGDDSRIRYFRIAIPDEGYEYIPNVNEKDKDLSKIANIGHSLPNIKVYSSALPKKHPNGRLTLDMGPYQVKRSLKNFIIRDEDNNILFLIFKSLDGICKIKAYPPFTPIVTFGLGVAILTSMK